MTSRIYLQVLTNCLVFDRKVRHNIVLVVFGSTQCKFGLFDNDGKPKRSRVEEQVKVRAKSETILPKTIPKLTAS